MGDKSKIEWTEATWNPIRGCSRVSEGCRNCYAERVAARFSGEGDPYGGLAVMKSDGPHWTGEVAFIERHLEDPLHWRKPRRIFVNSMSDLFHEKVQDEWIAEIFSVMARAPQHIFQVLTKRPKRMWKFCSKEAHWWGNKAGIASRDYGEPLPNVWLGVSVEDQATAVVRIHRLLQTPAALRWVSYEPALGEERNERYRVLRSNGR